MTSVDRQAAKLKAAAARARRAFLSACANEVRAYIIQERMKPLGLAPRAQAVLEGFISDCEDGCL